MKIFLDDERVTPLFWADRDEWVIVRNGEFCKKLIEWNYHKITDITFDHDLGLGCSGYDVIAWLEEYIVEEGMPKETPIAQCPFHESYRGCTDQCCHSENSCEYLLTFHYNHYIFIL